MTTALASPGASASRALIEPVIAAWKAGRYEMREIVHALLCQGPHRLPGVTTAGPARPTVEHP
ncbi:hypothetical protein [Streptomyces sp. NPDC096132]|uniref:hypothetical protein n=1 Tax=Streptomyces sp. NPDC096132 TaxID=3366075 RepID=UPI00382DABF6